MTREPEEEEGVRSGATERGAHWSAGKAGQGSGNIPFYGGFHNDTTPRYDEEAAKLAWSRTVEFLAEHLK